MPDIQLEIMKKPTPLERYELGIEKILDFYLKKVVEKRILNDDKITTEDEEVSADDTEDKTLQGITHTT